MPAQVLKRRGPSPLPVHIGMAWAGRNGAPGDVQHDMAGMMAGIQKYRAHSYERQVSPLPVVWSSGQVRLFHCPAEQKRAHLLLVPSLINKSYILDLMPQKSFVRWLAAAGIETYLLDWGDPLQDDGLCSFDALVTQRLCPALQAAREHAGERISALGYCMGGTLLAAAAMHKKDVLRNIVFLASPWDFDVAGDELVQKVRQGIPSALQILEDKRHLPSEWIQSVFAAVNADRSAQKFQEFLMLDDSSEKAKLFVVVEDWLNDGVAMPYDLARSCLLDWYAENRPGRGVWSVGGYLMNPAAINVPALVVASRKDRLVPFASSQPLATLCPMGQILEPDCGHIGMITGHRAERDVWRPIAEWLKNNMG